MIPSLDRGELAAALGRLLAWLVPLVAGASGTLALLVWVAPGTALTVLLAMAALVVALLVVQACRWWPS